MGYGSYGRGLRAGSSRDASAWYNRETRYDTKCKICGKDLPAGTNCWMRKAGKWEIICGECHTKVEGEVKKAEDMLPEEYERLLAEAEKTGSATGTFTSDTVSSEFTFDEKMLTEMISSAKINDGSILSPSALKEVLGTPKPQVGSLAYIKENAKWKM